MTSAKQKELGSLFTQTFPGQPEPASVLRRMESRLRELRGLRGMEEGIHTEAGSASALVLLHEFLARLPNEMRFGILELRVGEDVVSVRGQCRTHGDADSVAAKLRTGGRLKVEPPRTEQMREKGVTFALRARLSASVKEERS